MQGTTEVTFDTDADTIVKLTGKPATPADLKIKMHVAAVTALGTADTIVATIPKVAVSGQIVAIVGPDITILKGTVQTTFSTDANTVVKLTGKAATVADLKVGMAVTGTTELGIATALSATIPHVAVAGAITAINGANITVLKGVVQVTFATDANTKVTLNGKAATVADLKVGQTLTGTTALGVGLTVAAKG
jgi:hypothetical protein